jgi:glycosyltransferase involved in cell wall biosynthesis
MIKLCLIITDLNIGGAETMLLKLLQGLDRQRFSPVVISLTTQGVIGPRLVALGIPVTALNMRTGRPSPWHFWALVRQLRKSAPDVVHTWMYHADLLGGLAARLAGVWALAWGIRHSNLDPEHNKRSTLLVVKACALLSRWVPRRVLTCSERARTIHVAAGYCADKMVYVANGFDLTRFVPDAAARAALRAELGLDAGTPLVGLVARDDPQKNHLGFVQAAAQVHAALPQCHFVLAGQGIDASHQILGEAIAHAGLQRRFHLLGRRDDVPRLMASLDVLASPSHGEAFPNVLGEAMACGVPCVVTDVGDSAEIVGDTGWVVAADDMDAMARDLLTVLQMPAEQRRALGGTARARVQAHYELGDVTRRYEDFYNSLLLGD